MEFLKKTTESAVPRKRPLDEDTNDFKQEEFLSRKMVSKFPPPKRRTGVQIVRDFPPGCGTKENYQNSGNDKLEYKNVDHNILKDNKLKEFHPPKRRTGVQIVRDFPPGCGTKENYQNCGNDKLEYDNVGHNIPKDNKLKELEPQKSYLGSRLASKVKFWDPLACSKEGNAQKPIVTTTIVIRRKPSKMLDTVRTTSGNMTSYCDDKLVDTNHPYEYKESKSIKPRKLGRSEPPFRSRQAGKFIFCYPNWVEEGDGHILQHTGPVESWIEVQGRREQIEEAINMFCDVYAQLFQKNTRKPKDEKQTPWSITIDVAKIVKQNLRWMDAEKVVGSICGVQVGDMFKYRSQLHMVGLHCQPQSGIDYTRIGEKNLAISIVDSHRYSNESKSWDMLIYCGHGGLENSGHKLPPEDQKLKRGNLALRNSMVEESPVRVIRKVEGFRKNMVFVYDGLYIVKDCKLKKGTEGNMVFKFKLIRVPGQPQLQKTLNASR